MRREDGGVAAECCSYQASKPQFDSLDLSVELAQLRRQISDQIGQGVRDLFAFEATRCDRVVAGVFERLRTAPN